MRCGSEKWQKMKRLFRQCICSYKLFGNYDNTYGGADASAFCLWVRSSVKDSFIYIQLKHTFLHCTSSSWLFLSTCFNIVKYFIGWADLKFEVSWPGLPWVDVIADQAFFLAWELTNVSHHQHHQGEPQLTNVLIRSIAAGPLFGPESHPTPSRTACVQRSKSNFHCGLTLLALVYRPVHCSSYYTKHRLLAIAVSLSPVTTTSTNHASTHLTIQMQQLSLPAWTIKSQSWKGEYPSCTRLGIE